MTFWEEVGETFPSLKGAASTRYYFECERTLLETFAPKLRDRVVLKTDLWDEAKNTEILRWVAEQGARPVGVDIAHAIARQARPVLAGCGALLVVADVRDLPLRSETVDLVYSMGTIEHFPDYDLAVREIFRVLKPGGIAIVGVPNKLDPFLRPLMVHVLNRLGLYGYGREKSFTPRALRRVLAGAGFRVGAMSGVLFLPGWLRMLDLWLHVRGGRLGWLTAPLIGPFAWLYRVLPAVRRHGYLIAAIAERPTSPEGAWVPVRSKPAVGGGTAYDGAGDEVEAGWSPAA